MMLVMCYIMERLRDSRDFMLRVRMNSKERKMLESIVKETGLSASNIVRQLVRAEVKRVRRAA